MVEAHPSVIVGEARTRRMLHPSHAKRGRVASEASRVGVIIKIRTSPAFAGTTGSKG
jgi:hypothetical protein